MIVGFVFLVKGADWFVEGSASIAKRLGIPQLIIGLTIVAMGTSMPEAAVSITAALKQNAGITIGNVVGSNILNVFIILGVTALITNVTVQKSTLKYDHHCGYANLRNDRRNCHLRRGRRAVGTVYRISGVPVRHGKKRHR